MSENNKKSKEKQADPPTESVNKEEKKLSLQKK